MTPQAPAAAIRHEGERVIAALDAFADALASPVDTARDVAAPPVEAVPNSDDITHFVLGQLARVMALQQRLREHAQALRDA